MARRFAESRARQAAFVTHWSWLSPGLALVLWGQRQAGTDAASHAAYLYTVDRFEARWRNFFVPLVMSQQGLTCEDARKMDEIGIADFVS
jgi:ABC-2 type transport system permease protein